jgi:ParB family chromosome partitioning protein
VDFVDGIRGAVIESIPVDEINSSDETFQYRLLTDTNGLRVAIAREGQLEPVDLADSKPYRIIDGFRRFRAIRELGWTSVRAIVRRGLSLEAMHRIAFAKNVVRKNLRPLEKANAIRLARVRGCTPVVITEQFGISEKQIRRYDALLEFPKPLQQVVDNGALSMAHATVLARHGDIDVTDWVKQVQTGHWSAAELSRVLRKTLNLRRGGKRREYIRVNGNEVRGYSWRLDAQSNRAELETAIAAHKRALDVLLKLREVSSGETNPPQTRRAAR